MANRKLERQQNKKTGKPGNRETIENHQITEPGEPENTADRKQQYLYSTLIHINTLQPLWGVPTPPRDPTVAFELLAGLQQADPWEKYRETGWMGMWNASDVRCLMWFSDSLIRGYEGPLPHQCSEVVPDKSKATPAATAPTKTRGQQQINTNHKNTKEQPTWIYNHTIPHWHALSHGMSPQSSNWIENNDGQTAWTNQGHKGCGRTWNSTLWYCTVYWKSYKLSTAAIFRSETAKTTGPFCSGNPPA